MSDNVEHPSHYNTGSVETIDGIRAALGDAFLDYCRGNVIKYVWRCRHKGKLLEDLRKAAKYLEWAIEEAESGKPSEPQQLAIPEGWRELEENEPLSEDDLFELDGEWVGHECDPSGGVYSSRIHCRHIRKIKTEKPEPLAIPEGWRELEFGETRLKTDLYGYDGKWNPYTDFDPAGSDFPEYNKAIHYRHIRKIETANPSDSLAGKQGYFDDADGVWVDEPNPFDGRKIETENVSEAPSSSIPDPGPGYRLLSKDPPEPVVKGDEFWQGFNRKWVESENYMDEGCHQYHAFYYRRKIEPTEWFPKVGDRVRVRCFGNRADGKIGVIVEDYPGDYAVRIVGENLKSCNLKIKHLELIEAAQ